MWAAGFLVFPPARKGGLADHAGAGWRLKNFEVNGDMKSIVVDGVEYVPKDSVVHTPAKKLKGKPYCIVRTYSAGVFAGYVSGRNGKEAVVLNARRLWYWKGAASLSQLAVDGVSAPDECKFPCEVDKVELTEVIEVIECTEKAKKSIAEVPIWDVK